ncbi:hypothetical protein PROFUN_11073, partial [Planoprotostelium fungivorum]
FHIGSNQQSSLFFIILRGLRTSNLSNSLDLVTDFKARTARVTTSKRKRKN